MRFTLGVALGLALSLGACREDEVEIQQANPVVSSHSLGHWRSAQVVIGYEQRARGGHSDYASRLRHVLLLNNGTAVRPFELAVFFRDWEMLGGLPDAEFRAKAKTSFLLVFAADDHAIAISEDGGAAWRYIALDAGEEPLFCPHVRFRSADPWKTAPTTHALVLDILDPRSPSAHIESMEKRYFEQEVQAAGRFLCLHPDAADIRLAFARALVHPERPLEFVTSTWEPVRPCLQKAAQADPGFRSVLIEALHSRAPGPARSPERAAQAAEIDPRQLGEAAEILSDTADEPVQEVLAQALNATLHHGSTDTQGCFLLERLSRSLANVTVLRRAAPDSARTVLVELTRHPNACSAKDVSSGFGARIHAVRALAALPDSGAREALKTLARQECGRSPPAHPIPFDDWYATMDDQGRFLELPCWARAALSKDVAH